MDASGFDHLTRSWVSGLSRRSVLRRLVGSAATGPTGLLGVTAAYAQGKGKDKQKKQDKGQGRGNSGQAVGAGDRDVGHPCAGNQTCRAGLYCWPTGPGSVPRCTDQPPPDNGEAQQACTVNCEPAEAGSETMSAEQVIRRPASYWIDVGCEFDAPRYQTRCTCTGRGDATAGTVHKITLPSADICAVVVTQEMLPVSTSAALAPAIGEASAGTGGVANAEASGGTVTVGDVSGNNDIAIDASGGTASADASGGDRNVAIAGGQSGGVQAAQAVELGVLVLTLEGEVVPGKLTTYWVDTDQGRRPAPGPALVQVADETAETGTIIAEARACQVTASDPAYDWFGQCTTPVTGMAFSLYAPDDTTTPLATSEVNAQGRASFVGLPPGTYQLLPEGQAWCHAESDNVDPNGQVIVEAGLESHVWTFLCGVPAG